MKQPASFTVTEEAFPHCWEQIDQLRRKARLMSAVARLGGFLSNLFFLLSLLFLANGLIYTHFYGTYHAFLDSLPVFSDLWIKIAGFLLRPDDSMTAEVLKLLLSSYAASALLFAALALVVALIYHPLRRAVPTGTYQERTAALSKAAQEAWSHSFRTKLSTSNGATLLVVIAAFVLVTAYTVYLEDAEAATALLSKFPTQDAATNCLLYVLIAYLVCNFFCTILLLLTRFIYRYQFPYHWMAQVEAAVLFAQEESGELTPEEITAKRRERAAVLREEAIALEKEAAYQKAKNMLHEAALLGDVPAMEHYARHCLLSHLNDSARYWLEQHIASGEAGKEAKRMLLRLKLNLHHKEQYLRPDAAPLTQWQKVVQVMKRIFSVLWRIFIFVMILFVLAALFLLIKYDLDLTVFQDLPGAFSQLLN